MPKLTKRTVDTIRPDPAGDVFKWDSGDGAIKGFGVRMKPSGIASYLVQYRNQEGRTRRLVLGRVGTLTPDEARTLAGEALKKVAKGGDPSGDRKAARNAMTVAELCDWYLSEAKAGRIVGKKGRPIKASTLAMDRSRIEQHVKPLIGRRALSGLTAADIEDMQAAIARGKTAKARPKNGRTGKTSGGRGVAARTVGMLAAIMAHARVPNNPTRGVRRYADGKNKRFLTIEEIGALGNAMREAEAEGGSRIGIAAVRALLLTGCRRHEILALSVSWFDAKARCIRFGDTKSGEQNRPLGLAAAEFLSSRPNKGGWLFPAARGDGHFIGIARVLADLSERAGLRGVSPHTLRHSFGSIAAELGFSEITIAGLLGHAARGVTQRYSHVPDSALLAAADRVSARIAAALDGTTGAKVLPMQRRKARAL
jgi:integrase